MFPKIPEVTHPLGRHWEQPRDIRDAPMDDKHVLLTEYQFRQLHNYSATVPTGVYPGKCWRRQEKRGWLLVWYGIDRDPDRCTIEHREILVI